MCQEGVFLRQLFSDMGSPWVDLVRIKTDNQNAIFLSKNPSTQQRTKHIDIKLHSIRSLIKNGTVTIDHVS